MLPAAALPVSGNTYGQHYRTKHSRPCIPGMKRRPDSQTIVEDNGKPAQECVCVITFSSHYASQDNFSAIPHQDGVILPSAAAAGKNETHWIQLVCRSQMRHSLECHCWLAASPALTCWSMLCQHQCLPVISSKVSGTA